MGGNILSITINGNDLGLTQDSGSFLQTAQTWANSAVVELLSPLQVTHLPPVWDILLPLA